MALTNLELNAQPAKDNLKFLISCLDLSSVEIPVTCHHMEQTHISVCAKQAQYQLSYTPSPHHIHTEAYVSF